MKILKYAVSAVLLTWSFMWMQAAQANPGFARQTGMTCNACHFQHYPTLNAFGRAFKQEAYTFKGKQETIEDANLSLPVDLNIGLVTKLRYVKTNGEPKTTATNTGDIQFPDEAALLVGGRAGEHVGFLVEISEIGGAESNYNSFRVHFNKKAEGVNYGIVPFLTDAGGVPYGMELLNTGAQRFIRVAENRTATAAQQFIGSSGASGRPGGSEATGFAFIASAPQWSANFTLWHPTFNAHIAHEKFANYFRGAYMPNIGGWDTAFGIQLFGGTSEIMNTTTAVVDKTDTKASFVDAQTQGTMGGKPVGFYFTYGKADATPAGGTTNFFNSRSNDQKAWSLLGEVGVIPNRVTVYLGYLDGDNGDTTRNEDKRTTLGLTWMVAQNVELQFWNTWASGNRYDSGALAPAAGDQEMGLMLFAGF